MSVAPLRRKGGGSRSAKDEPLLHVSFLPHALAPLFQPVGSAADVERVVATEPVGGALPVPASPDEAVARLRSVWRGAPNAARSLPDVLSPLITVYRAVPALPAFRGVAALAAPPRPGVDANRFCPLLVCSEAAGIDDDGNDEAAAPDAASASEKPPRKSRRSGAARAAHARGTGERSAKLSGAADAYAVAGALTGTPLGSLREECARLQAVYSALLHVPRQWMCEAPGTAAGPDVVWVAAREGEAAAHAARKLLWWLVGADIVRQCGTARRVRAVQGAARPPVRLASDDGVQRPPPHHATSPGEDMEPGSLFPVGEAWPADSAPASPGLDSVLAGSFGFGAVDGDKSLEELLAVSIDAW